MVIQGSFMKICTVDGCERQSVGRGYCTKHYQRWRAHGTPDSTSRTHAPLEDRLWRWIDKREPNDCWPWTGATVRGGYGSIQIGGKGSNGGVAHRALYEIINGPVPDGMVVMHRCDNPPCCNPRHLTIGTYKENTWDMMAKGRRATCWPVGENNGKSKLTAEKVRYIRANVAKGYRTLSHELELDYTTVRNAAIGKSWKHVT